MPSFTLLFNQVDKQDVGRVGGKGANLGEMTSFGMPIPPGFVVTADAYKHFLEKNNLRDKMAPLLDSLDVNNSQKLEHVSKQIEHLISSAPIPTDISSEIMSAYLALSAKDAKSSALKKILNKFSSSGVLVAVRSSATSEDSKEASFAGQNETYLNIKGESNVVNAVRNCWASLFEARSIFYRVQNHFNHFDSAIAVVVQTMVQSEVSGIMFSIDPVTNNASRIVIETVWGLGEYIVQGKISPDHYEVNKDDLRIVEKNSTPQSIMLARDQNGHTKEMSVPKAKQNLVKLSDAQIEQLASLSKALEEHYHFPQDSEFAVEKDQIFLVQTRPITTTVKSSVGVISKQQEKEMGDMALLLTGAPASPGVKSGPVKILQSAKEIGRIVPGDVLVAKQTNPDYVPAMKKASAIVTDSGGRTSHAAIVSRELGIPCVVGTTDATKKLKDKEIITVNGTEGKVYKGGLAKTSTMPVTSSAVPTTSNQFTRRSLGEGGHLATKTHVYVNLAEPEKAKEIAAMNCDGVGLLRAEFVLAGIGTHPRKIIEDKKQKEFVKTLSEGLTTFAEAFYPRPVVYRATDFRTNEFRNLKGGEKYELHEENPMIGFRGAYRYIKESSVFEMEIAAIKKVRNDNGFKNFYLMIPFCRTVKELKEVKALLSKFGLRRSDTFKLWMMCEIPSNVINLEKFLEEGIDGISIGSNDLTMLTLGVDRDNETVASEYSELDDALLWSFEHVIKTCKKFGVTCSMCGQAPSDYPQLTEKLVEWGTTSVSVNPDVLDKTRQIVHDAELKVRG